MPITVFYTQITTSSGTEEFFATLTFRFYSEAEMFSIATYAKTEAELRGEIEDGVADFRKSFFGTELENDFFKKWKYEFIEESEEYLKRSDEIGVLVI